MSISYFFKYLLETDVSMSAALICAVNSKLHISLNLFVQPSPIPICFSTIRLITIGETQKLSLKFGTFEKSPYICNRIEIKW